MLPLRIVPVCVFGVLLLCMFRRLRRARRVFRFLFLRFSIALFVALGIGALFSSRRFLSCLFQGFFDNYILFTFLIVFELTLHDGLDKAFHVFVRHRGLFCEGLVKSLAHVQGGFFL
jgi:hypothetical protein